MLLLGPYHFCPLLCPSLMKYSLGISNFLEEISRLSHSIVFLYFFALITEEGFLISPYYSLELCIEMDFPFPLCFSLLFFSHLFVRPPLPLCFSVLFFSHLFVRPLQTTILGFCISFSWGWSWSLPSIQCHEPPSIVFQALCLSDLIT